MRIQTKFFGEMEMAENKIITLEGGLMGFENYTKYVLIYNEEGEGKNIMWFQSIEEPTLALPVIYPEVIKEDYAPDVKESFLKPLAPLHADNTCMLLTLTVSADIEKTTANLKAPLIINTDNKKGCQVIADNADYPVKYNVYEAVQRMKEASAC